jgi:hypothetical protein
MRATLASTPHMSGGIDPRSAIHTLGILGEAFLNSKPTPIFSRRLYAAIDVRPANTWQCSCVRLLVGRQYQDGYDIKNPLLAIEITGAYTKSCLMLRYTLEYGMTILKSAGKARR